MVQSFYEATIEHKQYIFTTFFKPDVSLQDKALPIDTNFLNEETKLVISLMSQFLGLDTDRYVTELLMSLLYRVSTSQFESQ